ncbi:hypothetical protein [Desulfoluna sp.]|uniref:hypothetical protein n=1 Tax=Desulfoluna sp. TaxID=2045199 RepID=UPI0026022BC9|nr:hypothetical protein [Desulfoluna sp.]
MIFIGFFGVWVSLKKQGGVMGCDRIGLFGRWVFYFVSVEPADVRNIPYLGTNTLSTIV